MNFATAWAWIRSWRKPAGTWTLDDYPVYTRPNGDEGFAARVHNWPTLTGLGDTRESALDDLRETFAIRQERPRPGTKVPIKFAASDQLDAFGTLAYEVVEVATGIKPYFMSDGSSLYDVAEDIEPAQTRIRDHYGVDISDIEDGDLVTILHRLTAAGIRAGAHE